jgi:hypothetical protein
VYPTIGFRIVTERSSPEDLPRLEINELSSNPILAAFIPVSKLLLFLFLLPRGVKNHWRNWLN